jgi:hypothetical protein
MQNEHQKFEKEWWGNCANTLGEELKQLTYARLMGLEMYHDGRSPFAIDAKHKSIIDIGGGPVSLLLKCNNLKSGFVIDPCNYPEWVTSRYNNASITHFRVKAESIEYGFCDEIWIYNCLQHVEDPEKIISKAKKYAKLIRIFEWVDIPPHEGHPHMLTKENLDKWLGKEGQVGVLNGENECFGRYYVNVINNN